MNQSISRLAVAAALAAVVLLPGCATEPRGAKLTYVTEPLGATLYENGQSLGIAPVTRTYPVDASGGQIRTTDITAVWPSGAKTSFWTFLKPGDDNVATLTRPAGGANLQADLDNARKYMDAEARAKEQTRRDLARSSARCLAQQHGGGAAGIDDCN
ncbi:MAG: hypothetical protein ABJD97_20740 [Betaproteobacteria bacterium]